MSAISIIILTYNAENKIERQLKSLLAQSLKGEIIVVDSHSADKTVEKTRALGVKSVVLSPGEFDHGGTRTEAAQMATGEILVYLTQDALPANADTIRNLTAPLLPDNGIAAAYGRQLPFPHTSPFGRHLRIFNYPEVSHVKSIEDLPHYGFKTLFLSNSFAAYRRQVLQEIGWFKNHLIMSEDTCAAANLLLQGYKIAYVSEAQVYHAHNYNLVQEFRRHFDIGVFHQEESWMLDRFGTPEREGTRYVRSELRYLCQNRKFHLIFHSILRNLFKYIAYRLGRNYRKLPPRLAKKCSMHAHWWNGNHSR